MKKPRPPKNDLTGQQFGSLEVLRMEQTEKSVNGQWRVICRCHRCGNDNYEISVYRLKKSNACGCTRLDFYKKNRGINNKRFSGYEEIAGSTWNDIKQRSKRRGYEVLIPIEEVWEIFEKQKRKCALSDIPIQFGRRDYPKETTASLDRIDSTKGYVKENVQWVHKSVNIMKNTLDERMFVNLCRRVVTAKSDIPYMSNEEVYEQYVSRDYINQIKKRGSNAAKKRRSKKKER